MEDLQLGDIVAQHGEVCKESSVLEKKWEGKVVAKNPPIYFIDTEEGLRKVNIEEENITTVGHEISPRSLLSKCPKCGKRVIRCDDCGEPMEEESRNVIKKGRAIYYSCNNSSCPVNEKRITRK